MERSIKVSGAREHNLKNVTVSIPHGKHTVIAGVSGSGKSTLAYDVIYAAGQKRLLDCLAEPVRRFTSALKQPDVNYIKGLTPVISMKQYKPKHNPRATIGTLTEVSTYLRYMFTLMGQASCPVCGRRFPLCSLQHLIRELQKLPEGTTVELHFPVYKTSTQKYDEFFAGLRKKGYKRVEIDGERKDLRDWVAVAGQPGIIMAVADRIQTGRELSRSTVKALQDALLQGEGFLRLVVPDPAERESCAWFFRKHGCSMHGVLAADILPAFFSFNDLNSACPECRGTGIRKAVYPAALVKNKEKSLRRGPFFPQIYNPKQPVQYVRMFSLARHFGFSFDAPFQDLSDRAKDLIFHGSRGEAFPLLRPHGYDKELPGYIAKYGDRVEFEGLVTRINKYYENKSRVELTEAEESFFNRFMSDEVCPSCHGTRLKPQRQLVTVGGHTFNDLGSLELSDLKALIRDMQLPGEKGEALAPIVKEIKARLDCLIRIGLGYLSLDRRADTLSGGEYQRVRLAGQLGSGLMGLTYVVDEPSTGLHGMDNKKIITLLEQLREQGNTVITIEHDLDIIRGADHIIEMGPGAGIDGGQVIASGTIEEVAQNSQSVLAKFLSQTGIGVEKPPIGMGQDSLEVIGAQANNLKNIDVTIPLNALVCLTGISGSGKSSLAVEVLYKAFWSSRHDPRVLPGRHLRIDGMEKVRDVYCIDQSPIARTSTSIPATYIGVFDAIRRIFAESADAGKHGLTDTSFFSFNARGGCPSCKGRGSLETHIHYLGDLETPCPVCQGMRFTREVLEVKYKGKNIAQVLDLGIETALSFFADERYIAHKLQHICDLGLGYMKLGQQIGTVSGGEAQRLRLARELSKLRGSKGMLYIMDEPTTGLHSQDIEKLLAAMRAIINRGNSLVVIEHNPEVIINADYIIDIGPGAGKNGGEVVAAGSLETIMGCPRSKTGQYLNQYYLTQE